MKRPISTLLLTALLAAAPGTLGTPAIAADPAAPVPAAGAVTPVGAGGTYSLDQFGNVATNPQGAFDAATKYIEESGGGILMIPLNTAAGWAPRYIPQHVIRIPAAPALATTWHVDTGVTVVDARGKQAVIFPPAISGIKFKRILDTPPGEGLPHWDYFPMISMENIVARGSTSYHDWLQEDVAPGKDAKFYVRTIRGLFPDMFLTDAGAAGGVARIYVKSLGYDKQKKCWYFTADTTLAIPKNTILSNKNHVNLMRMETYSHNENQTFDIALWCHNYSQGDNYLFDARFKYMGDIHSTAGDENGVIFAAFVESELNAFKGTVDAWNPATGELKFKGAGTSVKTLGSGRPIINLNPKKCITAGSVFIVRPASWTDVTTDDPTNPVFRGKTYPTTIGPDQLGDTVLHMGGLIRFSADAPVTEDAVGRYFAVDEPDEFPKGTQVRRWYLIDSVTKNADGTKDIKIIRHWWGAKPAGSPTLFSPASYSSEGHEKALKYIIAPGANAYDVSDGLDSVGNKSILRLAPTPFTGDANVDFASDDPIEQAVGPDPFHPQSFRSWTWDAMPGVFPASYLDLRNLSEIQRHSIMTVRGGTTDLARDTETRHTHIAVYDRLLEFLGTCNSGIVFGADVANAAIKFEQPHDRAQPIQWAYGEDKVKKTPAKLASLTVSPADGTLTYDGSSVAAPGGLTNIGGLSGGAVKANNLRGIDQAVKAGDKEMKVTFAKPEADAGYGLFVETSWMTMHVVSERTPTGFTVKFSEGAPANATFHWLIVH